jgi:hypothetical protein
VGLVAGSLGSIVVLSSPPVGATGTMNSRQAYITECNMAGVPTPPVWNYEDAFHNVNGTKWVNGGVLSPDFLGEIGNTGLTAEVFYYVPPNNDGVCIALPRSFMDANGIPISIPLNGVICQSVTTSKACFFDLHNSSRFDTVQPTGFISGAELDSTKGVGGICTECHRGENVFIIHPNSALGNVPNTMPNAWHDPLVFPAWTQNPGPTTLFDGAGLDGCTACHSAQGRVNEGDLFGGRFPDLASPAAGDISGYCNNILKWSVGRTMPLAPRPGGFASFAALSGICDGTLPSQMMMSFEAPASQFWFSQTASLSNSTTLFTERAASMSVDASGYVRLDSIPVNSWDFDVIGTRLDLDVYVPPAGQPQPFWLGAVQLYLTIPGAQMVNNFIGQVELTPGGTGWRTAAFTLPANVRAALLEAQSNVRIGIAVNTPNGAPPILLDNLRFNGTLVSGPNPPPAGAIQYDFESGNAWEGHENAITGTARSTTVAFSGSWSLAVNFAGSGDGRFWTAPAVSPPAGKTISYRFFIPSGAPVTAIQPYVMDKNWVWTDSWNTNLPRSAWVTLTVTVPANATLPLNQIGAKVYLSAPYNGSLYLDAVQW